MTIKKKLTLHDVLLAMNQFASNVMERFDRVDKRFEQVDKRFEQVDKRFEQVDKRFDKIDKRFEQVDRRFEKNEDKISGLHALMHVELQEIRSEMATKTDLQKTKIELLTHIDKFASKQKNLELEVASLHSRVERIESAPM